jgi:hypothetical protein
LIPVFNIASANIFCAVETQAVIVFLAYCSRMSFDLHTYSILALLGLVLTVVVGTTVEALFSDIIAEIGLAHVVIIITLLSQGYFSLAGVINERAVLSDLVAVRSAFSAI